MSAEAYNVVIIPRGIEIRSKIEKIWFVRDVCCICGCDKPTEVRLPEDQWEEFPDEPRIKHIEHKNMILTSISTFGKTEVNYNLCVCFACIYLHGSINETKECKEKIKHYEIIDTGYHNFRNFVTVLPEFKGKLVEDGKYEEMINILNWLPQYPNDIEKYEEYTQYMMTNITEAQKNLADARLLVRHTEKKKMYAMNVAQKSSPQIPKKLELVEEYVK